MKINHHGSKGPRASGKWGAPILLSTNTSRLPSASRLRTSSSTSLLARQARATPRSPRRRLCAASGCTAAAAARFAPPCGGSGGSGGSYGGDCARSVDGAVKPCVREVGMHLIGPTQSDFQLLTPSLQWMPNTSFIHFFVVIVSD